MWLDPTRVYFARDPATGLIKIGKCANLHGRLITLRSKRPGLELIASAPGSRAEEDALHHLLFEHHRGAEWFWPHAQVEACAAAVAKGWLIPKDMPRVISPIKSALSLKGHATRRAREAAERASQPYPAKPSSPSKQEAA